MSALVASAPGKVVLSGDFAVLDGAPAVVLALARRARVSMEAGVGSGVRLSAPQIGAADLTGQVNEGDVCWATADDALQRRLALVSEILAQGLDGAARAIRLQLDTADFFAPGGRLKLGLGSSAAVTVALAGALARLDERQPPVLQDLLVLHRRVQAGRGSGLDLAASLHGGVLVYRLVNGVPSVECTPWPVGLRRCLVWSGRTASTTAALAQLAEWRASTPASGAVLRELAAGAEQVAAAVLAGNAGAVVEGVGVYAVLLERLGQASGIDIVCAEHRHIMAIARRYGLAYKTCGAGGGDVGMALATDPDRVAVFARQMNNEGFSVLDAAIDPQGLMLAPVSHDAGDESGRVARG